MNIDSNYEVVTKLTEAKQSAQLQIGQQAKSKC